ncbi:MAG TPA: hypothetical protein VMH30_09005 [Verrucomicrobiae bacterium]|nr:hypothetical protein [Verrucomicrobiae bacterium]
MTKREVQIARRILDILHDLDGGQSGCLLLHFEIGGVDFCTTAEFDNTMKVLDAKQLITGMRTKFRGISWNISDAGEAARMEM